MKKLKPRANQKLKSDYLRTPSLKTCREVLSEEVAPTNAEVSVNGVTTMFPGTSFKVSLPLMLRVLPSFRNGLVVRITCCLHFWVRNKALPLRDKKLCLRFRLRLVVGRGGKKGE